ncbi:MAG: VOC family protein [Ilumatobacteraceae bacterium]
MTDTHDSSIPDVSSLHVYLGYRDAPAAIEWLERALGFTTTMRYPDDQGGIMHAELCLGGAAITLFSDNDGYDRLEPKGETVGQGIYLSVAANTDVDAAYSRAVATDATVVWEAARSEWNYRCRVRDPEGREWTVGTHVPGASTDTWSDDG